MKIMVSWLGYVLDAIFILVFALTVVYFVKQGFVKSFIDFIGKIAALLVAFFASMPLSEFIYEKLLQTPLTNYVSGLVSDMGSQTLDEYLSSNAANLPEFMRDFLTDSAGTGLSQVTDDITASIIQNLVQPIVVQAMAVLFFIIIFIIIMVLVKVLAKTTKVIDKIPVLGKANKGLGIVLGVACAAIQTVILLIIVWFVVQVFDMVIVPGSGNIFDNSILYSTFMELNPLNLEQGLLFNDLY